MNGFADSSVVVLAAIPGPVTWAYFIFIVVLVTGFAAEFVGGDWHKTRGLDKLVLFGAMFYAAPIAAFGTEHFTQTKEIASIVPAWIPWHYFWTYLVGACFVAAGLSLVTKIEARLAASLLAVAFFLFVVLMDAPGWAQNPRDRFSAALALRELSFGSGALALAMSLTDGARDRITRTLTTVARYVIAVSVLYYSFEQFMHAEHVPGIPLEMVTPTWLWGHIIWTYLGAAVYAVAGILLIAGWKTRTVATWLGLTVLFLVVVVYIPIGVAERASLEGFNYLADTLMYCGAILMLAGAMPRDAEELRESVLKSKQVLCD